MDLQIASNVPDTRVAAEHTLRQLAAIVESSHDAIVGENLEGVIQSWNPGAEQMYGYTPAEILAKPANILLPPAADDELRMCGAHGKESTPTTTPSACMRKDGKEIKVALTVSPIRDSHGAGVGASTIPATSHGGVWSNCCIGRKRWKLSGVLPGAWPTTSTTWRHYRLRILGPYEWLRRRRDSQRRPADHERRGKLIIETSNVHFDESEARRHDVTAATMSYWPSLIPARA
jgi:PAS domain S-box-containing protein